MVGETAPMLLAELHPFPVVIAGGVLLAELHAPRFGQRALGGGDVGLEFDDVCSRPSDSVDIGMGGTQTAFVILRNLCDNQAAVGRAVKQRRQTSSPFSGNKTR